MPKTTGVTDLISHDDARELAMRYIDLAFGNYEKKLRPVHSIPVNPATDSDVRLLAYIDQQAAKEQP